MEMHPITASGIMTLAAVLAASVPSDARAQAPTAAGQTQIGHWSVIQRTHGCAIKTSGSDAESAPAYFRPFRGETQITVGVTPGNLAPLSIFEKARGRLRIEQGPTLPVEGSLLIVLDTEKEGFDPKHLAIVTIEPDAEPSFRAALAKSPAAQIEFGGRRVATLNLADAEPAWQEADRCLSRVGEALLTASPPPRRDGSLVSRETPWPRQSPAAWIDPDSYPREAIKAKAGGDVRVALSIDRYGYPTACRIVQGAGFRKLDEETCERLQRRGRFYPALDATGAAVDGRWETTVKWRFEDN